MMTALATNPFQRFLKKVSSRSVLGAEERRAILNLPGHPVQVRSNRDFVRLGERVDHACLVVDGLVGCFGQNKEGHRQITSVHISGDMADLNSVVAPEAASALQALTVSTILKVPHAALLATARRYPQIAEAFWRESVIDAAILSEWVVNVGRRDARTRMAHLLCEMAWRNGSVGQDRQVRFAFPVTQNHQADMLALTPVHVNRTLKTLREEGLVVIQDRSAHILDWPGLVEAGEFDPTYLRLDGSPQDNVVAIRRPGARASASPVSGSAGGAS